MDRFEQIETHLNHVDHRLNAIDERFNQLSKKIDGFYEILNGTQQRIDYVNLRQDRASNRLNERIDVVYSRVFDAHHNVAEKCDLSTHESFRARVNEHFEFIDVRFDRLDKTIAKMQREQSGDDKTRPP